MKHTRCRARRAVGQAGLVLLGMLAAAAPPASGAPLATVEQAGSLRMGMPGDYRPYAAAGVRPGQLLGADVALGLALAAHLGVAPHFVATSWPSLSADARAGRFDIAAGGITITAARREFASFSRPLARDGKTALAVCGRLGQLDELRELDQPQVRVIVNPGGTNEAFARARLPRAQLIVHADNLGVFGELVAGRADVMITDGAEALLQQALHPGVLCTPAPRRRFDRHDKAIMITGDAALRGAVDAFLRPLARSGALARLQQRWLDYPWDALSRPEGRLLGLIDARLALMSEVARAKWNTGAAIEDRPRELELLASLVEQAQARGVPRQRTEAFFEAQFAAARAVQEDLFALWRRQKRGRLPPAQDLRADLRPQLDALSAELVDALAAEGSPAPLRGAVLTIGLTSPRAERLALAPLAPAGTSLAPPQS